MTWSGFASVDGNCQCFNGGCPSIIPESLVIAPVLLYTTLTYLACCEGCVLFNIILCVHLSDILTRRTLSVNLSVSVVQEWRHTQLSLMALCSTCSLTGQGSTAPEADSHKQKLCVYWHQATTSLSPVGGGWGGRYLIGYSK